MDYKELSKEDLLLEQIKNLTSLIEQLKINPPRSGEGERKSKIKDKVEFTKKEIKQMPRLKDFQIRIKDGKYYEIRFRKYGYNMRFSSKDFEKAKQKAFSWLTVFEHEIKRKQKFVVVRDVNEDVEKEFTVFGPFAYSYMENVKKRMVKPDTYKNLMNAFKKHVLCNFKNVPIKDITPIMLQSYLSEVHDEKPRLCETLKTLLNNVLDYAVNNGIIKQNPVKAVYIPKHYRKNGQAFSPQKEKQFVKAIKGNKYESYYLKMLYSGVRPGEVGSIKEDVGHNTITIANGKLKHYQKDKFRTIPIFPKYKQILELPIPEKATLEQLRKEFKRFCPNNTMKDLRHTFTTRARECGVDNELVAVWTGHTLGNITSSVYTHFSMEHQQKEAKKVVYEY